MNRIQHAVSGIQPYNAELRPTVIQDYTKGHRRCAVRAADDIYRAVRDTDRATSTSLSRALARQGRCNLCEDRDSNEIVHDEEEGTNGMLEEVERDRPRSLIEGVFAANSNLMNILCVLATHQRIAFGSLPSTILYIPYMHQTYTRNLARANGIKMKDASSSGIQIQEPTRQQGRYQYLSR